MNSWWSWGLFILGAYGLWLMTTRPKIGPWFNIVGQVAWFTYGAVTGQWGFVASSITYAVIFGRMLVLAHRREAPRGEGEKEQGQVLVPPVRPAGVPEPGRRAGEGPGPREGRS